MVVLPWSSPRLQHHAAVARKIHLSRLFRFPEPPLIDGQINAATDADTAHRAAFKALATRSAPTILTEQVRVEMSDSHDDPALRARQMGEALYARITP